MRPSRLLLAAVLAAAGVSAMAQADLPAGKIAPAAKVIIRSTDAEGRTIYSDHMVRGTKVNKTFDRETFSWNESTTPSTSKSSTPRLSSEQEQVDAKNRKIDEANALTAKRNCAVAEQDLARFSATAATRKKGVDAETEASERGRYEELVSKWCKS